MKQNTYAVCTLNGVSLHWCKSGLALNVYRLSSYCTSGLDHVDCISLKCSNEYYWWLAAS